MNRLFARRDAQALVDTYPRDHFKTVKGYDGEKGYEYESRPLIHLGAEQVSFADELSDAWRRLANDLLSPAYRRTMSRFLGRDLTTAPMEAYVCHFGPGAWLGPHVDLKDKIMTHVFYFNETWNPRDGGCLNILRSSDMSDSIAEIAPIVGNIVRAGARAEFLALGFAGRGGLPHVPPQHERDLLSPGRRQHDVAAGRPDAAASLRAAERLKLFQLSRVVRVHRDAAQASSSAAADACSARISSPRCGRTTAD